MYFNVFNKNSVIKKRKVIALVFASAFFFGTSIQTSNACAMICGITTYSCKSGKKCKELDDGGIRCGGFFGKKYTCQEM